MYINDLVSIITPVYNAEYFISDTIKSVIQQTYEKWEMIIVDDCSIDNSYEIIMSFAEKDERIRCIRLTNNSGVAEARNVALKVAKGEFICFLDADDLWVSHKLQQQIDFMKKNKYAISFTAYELIDKNNKPLKKIISIPKKVTYYQLLKGNVIGCLTIMINRSLIGEFLMPKIRHEDYATWLSLLKRGYDAYGINEVLAQYRYIPTSLSGNKFKVFKWTWNIYRKHENLSIIKSLYYFINYLIKSIRKHYL